MTAKSVLMSPQGLRPGEHAPTCPLATPLYAATSDVNKGPVQKDISTKSQKIYPQLPLCPQNVRTASIPSPCGRNL